MSIESKVIIIDGEGGDNAPHSVIEALKKISKEKSDLWKNVSFHVCCYAENVKKFQVIKCVEKVIECEKTSTGTLSQVIKIVANKEAIACLSAGNTGAYMLLAIKYLKKLPLVKRPALISVIPSNPRDKVMVDLGANLQAGSFDLVTFALMGSSYAKYTLNYDHTKIGLLNVGSESFKGTLQLKETKDMLAKLSEDQKSFESVGFIEGDEVFHKDVDVVVTDGFTGNVLLKFAEGLAKFFFKSLKENSKKSFLHKIAGLFAKFLVKGSKKLDPSNHNSATLMGLDGFVVKAHGNSDSKAFYSSLKYTAIMAEKNDLIISDLEQKLEKLNTTFGLD